MTESDIAVAERLDTRMEVVARRVLWGVVAVLLTLVSMTVAAGYWAGSTHAILESMSGDLRWVTRVKIPEMDAESKSLRTAVDSGILPDADRRLGIVEDDHREMQGDIIRLEEKHAR